MILVFAGPSIDRRTVESRLDCLCLPPCGQGDIYRAAAQRPSAIAIIDGYFSWIPAVWHKEILWALDRGIHVYGASSMGALRAAELAEFGMVGVGRIFEDYRTGAIDDDSEVALLHGPESVQYQVATLPLVNVRATLAKAVAEGVVTPDLAERLLAMATEIHFSERTLETLFGGRPDLLSVRGWWEAHAVDQKREDALSLLERLRLDLPAFSKPFEPSFRFERTALWDDLVRRAGQIVLERPTLRELEVGRLDAASVARSLRPDQPEVCELRGEALSRSLALAIAADRRLSITEEALLERIENFRRELGLLAPEDLDIWLSDNDLTRREFVELMTEDRLAASVLEAFHPESHRSLLNLLRLRNLYSSLKGRAAGLVRPARPGPEPEPRPARGPGGPRRVGVRAGSGGAGR